MTTSTQEQATQWEVENATVIKSWISENKSDCKIVTYYADEKQREPIIQFKIMKPCLY